MLRAIDNHGLQSPNDVRHVTVTMPPGNLAPVASFSYSCNENICTFDGRSSTDENTPALSYAWRFGTQGTGTGPVPTKTFTAVGSVTVTLTITDEWLATSTATATLAIVEPTTNGAPAAVISPPACSCL